MSPMGRRAALGVVIVVALGLGVGIGALLFDGDDGGDRVEADGPATTDDSGDATETSSTVTTEPGSEDQSSGLAAPTVPVEGLSGDALAFAEALNRASEMTYRARYEGRGGTQSGDQGEVVVELWRRLPLARRDFTIVGAGQRFASREYRTTSGVIGCLDTTDDGTDDFQCTSSPGGGDPAAPAFGAVDPHDGAVIAEDDSVGGVEVRCYRVTPDAGVPQEVCFDGAGVPVVVDDGELRLVRTAIDSEVTDADLAPPSN